MLQYITNTINTLLHDNDGLPAQVLVECAVPDADWRDTIVQPTICFYLFDMIENTDFRNSATQTTRANGRVVIRAAMRRVDLRFMVCAFSSAPPIEQALIWRTMAVLLRHTTLPIDLLPTDLKQLGIAIQTKVGPYQDAPRLLDLWTALGLPPRPALLYTMTVPLDLEQETKAPLVLWRTLRMTRPQPEDERRGMGVRTRTGNSRETDLYATEGRTVNNSRLEREGNILAGRICARGGVPIKGALICALNNSSYCLSTADGIFSLGALPDGSITIRIRLVGEPFESASGQPAPRPDFEVETPWPIDIVLL